MKKKQKVALVLSSGGSRGLAHIGVIQALKQHDFEISAVSGSSIGSIIGGLYAMNQLDTYVDWVSSLSMKSVWGLLDFTFNKQGFIKGDKVFDKMKTLIPDVNIEQMTIPFAAVAADLLNVKDVVFKKGSYYDAIRASISIPALLTPVKYGNSWLVDGGVLNPLPIEYVKRSKNDILVVVNLHGKNSGEVIKTKDENEENYFTKMFKLLSFQQNPPKGNIGYYDLINFSTSAMINKLTQMTIEKYQPEIIIDIPSDASGVFEFYKAKELIELGYSLANEQISKFLQNENI